MEHCLIWHRDLYTKKIGAEVFGKLRNGVLEENGGEWREWSEKATNEQVLECIGVKRTLINYILCRKDNWIGQTLRRNCLLHNATEGQMMEVKGVGRRRTQHFDDLRN